MISGRVVLMEEGNGKMLPGKVGRRAYNFSLPA
jgi:hypothetical protein